MQMRRIKVLVLGLVLGVAGVAYAAGGNAQSTSADNKEMNCSMAGCCTGGSCQMGGSCCAAKRK
jgi:hypothetical protein